MNTENVFKAYKTKQCKSVQENKECQQKKTCSFFHSEEDRRRPPTNPYKPFLCLEAITNPYCTHDMCKYCKNLTEYNYHPSNFKTKECIYFKHSIQCQLGYNCPYYHSPEEKLQSETLRQNCIRQVEDKEGYESESESETPLPENHLKPSVSQRRPSERGFYIFKEEVKTYEDRNTEFKACTTRAFNISLAVELIAPYVSAFLNTEGGTIYYGVRDDGVVTGVVLNRKLRDNLVLALDAAINKFTPHVNSDNYNIHFADVCNSHMQKMPEMYVVEISVKAGSKNEVYFTHKKEAYIRRDASICQLSGPQIVKFFQARQVK